MQPIERGTFVGSYTGELISVEESHSRTDDTYLFNLAGTHIPLPTDGISSFIASPDCEDRQSNLEFKSPNHISEKVCPEKAVDLEKSCSVADIAKERTKLSESDEELGETKTSSQVKTYICDAKFYGNFTRFINHSCRPNLTGIRSFTDHQDQRFPYISFFANQFIPGNTELTLNYGDSYWIVKCVRDKQYCLCKSASCKFTKKTFPTTHEMFKKQQQDRN